MPCRPCWEPSPPSQPSSPQSFPESHICFCCFRTICVFWPLRPLMALEFPLHFRLLARKPRLNPPTPNQFSQSPKPSRIPPISKQASAKANPTNTQTFRKPQILSNARNPTMVNSRPTVTKPRATYWSSQARLSQLRANPAPSRPAFQHPATPSQQINN